ncbi:polyprenyl synthetase family protein [Rhodococcus sp. BP-349]|jgi:heptaprenyl diphosphate synthase|uniref:polyprenyl synthetase family protein n=1 Tax=unclassified Rhodococcus (in: high G+C Gram-positive bacteria) TaxID=192944 RepID=UPI001C9A650D|nr:MULTISPECIES: polyprenyl synthetase family protein [unclassified Rhodococcus (in: high G+C Gram-positive bacteria)]MBY6539719.1 polyprenyl synthetase family protein [Rhodococcus sp. BP-363]MBY6543953.1 polyprenyl synthetase family protein [Rhodococcus sp. BP-369]MBY6563183.1 polyprenyl synthetase family protein [Rhodococcus sp. BP-370]MBY6577475.1 polyprenyl synthetase family protein [Rhodococcus sp. BP-364]MBY6586776.1 polyprenyl synthetase family protein [Rhodococcus sp. BP-358]
MGASAVTETSASGATVVAGVDLGNAEFAETVRTAMAEVESLLVTELSDGEDFLTEAALHLAKAGGKRFRPLFTILTGQLGPKASSPDIVTAATVLEMVHLATLYHDDVMDEAAMRRGVESANARWGNSVAILAGDYLFAHASRLVSTLGPSAVRTIAETFAALVTGQMRETIGSKPDQDPVDHYLTTVWEKTGSLIATSGRFGGTFSGGDDEHIERLERLGDAVGTAFQISDDIIDISSAASDSGKTPGTDLREGVHTLPVLFALRDQGADGDRLRHLLRGPITDDADVAEALTLLGRSPGMAKARETLDTYAQRARTELDALPQGPANDALRKLVEYTVARIS